MARRSLIHNREGVSTTEYVILLLVVACIGIAGWRLLGTTAFSRATSASGDMSGLGSSGDGSGRGGGGGGGGGGGASSGSPRTRLEDATADATPPPDPKDELVMPFTLLAGALLLLIAMGAKRMKKGDGGGGGSEGGDLTPGKPDESTVYTSTMLPDDDDLAMPPKGDRLTDEQKNLIKQWIAQGAEFGAWKGAEE
jgi:hypothetical protein